MTWTIQNPHSPSWTTDGPYSLFEYLLQENGSYLFQEDDSKMIIGFLWAIDGHIGVWSSSSPGTSGFTLSQPHTTVWN
jgi:hypothetical protein